MPLLARPDGCTIYYETRGQGVPVLLIANGGMNSMIPAWGHMPWDPWNKLPLDKFCLIGMDQRNAGPHSRSPGPLGDGWPTYAADQLALLDHLGIEKCLLVGSCIGPSYMFSLLQASPERFPGAVMMQPIGRGEATIELEPWEGDNMRHTDAWFNDWAGNMMQEGRAEEAALRTLQHKMFRGESGEFVFSVSRAFVAGLQTPIQVLMGVDFYHPTTISKEIASLAPNAELIESWRSPADHARVQQKVEKFLLKHAGELHSTRARL